MLPLVDSYIWAVICVASFVSCRSIVTVLGIHLKLKYLDPGLYAQSIGWGSISNCLAYTISGPIFGKIKSLMNLLYKCIVFLHLCKHLCFSKASPILEQLNGRIICFLCFKGFLCLKGRLEVTLYFLIFRGNPPLNTFVV